MADDTAALVLSLEARFDKFEKAMKDAANVVDKQTKIIEQRFDAMTKVISDKLAGITTALTAQAGIFGQALATLGPLGIAAAVGIGALVEALNATAAAAERVGQKAVALRAFSIGTGLTIEQAQGMRAAFNAMGVDVDQAQKAIELFSVQLNELRRTGGGPLVESLNQIDKSLVATMLDTRSTAEAFEVFIRALARMTTEQRNAIARQAGGRGGIEVFAELAENAERFIAQVNAGTAAAKKSKEQVDEIVATFRQMNALQKQVGSAWDEAFPTTEFMNARISQLQAYLRILDAFRTGGAIGAMKEIFRSSAIGQAVTAIQTGDTSAFFSGVAKDADRLKDAFEQVNKQAAELAERQKAIAATSTAPGADDQLRQRADRLAEINKQIAELQKIQQVAGPGFTPEQAAQLQRLILLQREFQQAADPALTAARLAGEKAISDALKIQVVAMRERLGVASEEQIQLQKNIEIEQARSRGIITTAEAERASLIAAKEARERYNAELVRGSNLPGLTRMALDAKDMAKQFDQFAVSSLNTFTDSLADAITGTKTLAQAFQEMVKSILRDLVKLAIRQAIVAPLLQSFGLGGTGGFSLIPRQAGGPVMPSQAYLVGEHGPEMFVPRTPGMIVPNNGSSSAVRVSAVYNINAAGADVQAVRRMEVALAATNASIEDRVRRVITSDVRRRM